jgi:hypothetical protein
MGGGGRQPADLGAAPGSGRGCRRSLRLYGGYASRGRDGGRVGRGVLQAISKAGDLNAEEWDRDWDDEPSIASTETLTVRLRGAGPERMVQELERVNVSYVMALGENGTTAEVRLARPARVVRERVDVKAMLDEAIAKATAPVPDPAEGDPCKVDGKEGRFEMVEGTLTCVLSADREVRAEGGKGAKRERDDGVTTSPTRYGVIPAPGMKCWRDGKEGKFEQQGQRIVCVVGG